jgi:hypothetical protein
MTERNSVFAAAPEAEIPTERLGDLFLMLEDLMSPDQSDRSRAVEGLLAEYAHRRSPLVAAALALSVDEPDLELRGEIVSALAGALSDRLGGPRSPARVRRWIRRGLRRVQIRTTVLLLEVAGASDQDLTAVCTLFNACSHSGDLLISVLTNRDLEVSIREIAARAIARVGFLEARPAMEKLERRLVERSERQLRMPFGVRPERDAGRLLPVVRQALVELSEASL